jgi:flagellar basal-body rod protein FlgB
MFAKMTEALDFHAKALVLRSQRQQVLASNIANADTPGYAGRDTNFKAAMAAASGSNALTSNALLLPPRAIASSGVAPNGTAHQRHIALQASTTSLDATRLEYTTQSQPTMDSNSVDMDRERASFADNAVRYEATLRFINGSSRTILSAIQGQ